MALLPGSKSKKGNGLCAPGFHVCRHSLSWGRLTQSRVCLCSLCRAGQRGKRPGLYRVTGQLSITPRTAPNSFFLKECLPRNLCHMLSR